MTEVAREKLLNAVTAAPKEDLLEILGIVVLRCLKEGVDGRQFRRVFVGAMKIGVDPSIQFGASDRSG